MAYCDAQYYERIGAIQQSLHEKEKRRLELERELFAHSRSDTRISQVSKLSGYLKEICERERQAKIRNLELLRDVECIEMNMHHHPDHSSLHQQKVECLKRISKFMAVRGKKEDQTLEANKGDIFPQQDDFQSHLAKDLCEPAGIFLSRQTSGVSAAEDTITSVHSWQALHSSPNRRPRSSKRPPSGLLKDSEVPGEAAADSRARLSDDISGSNDSHDGCNLSDRHERMAAAAAVAAAPSVRASAPFGADERPPSPPATLERPGKNSPSRGSVGPVCERNPPAEPTHSREDGHQDAIKERGHRGSASETGFEKASRDEPERSESIPSSSMELSVTSDSDLSVSLTDSELPEDGPQRPDTPPTGRSGGPQGPPERSATPAGSELHSSSLRSVEPPSDAEPKARPRSSRGSTPPETSSERLISLEGFFHLLESIEARLCGEHTNVYRGSSVSERQRQELISLCNTRAACLSGEDLEACGAVVLHQLQRLSWSMSKGCLLPEEIVKAHRSNAKPESISCSLPRDAAPLWDRWFKHALLLKHRRVLGTERLVQLFTPTLVQRHASYSRQAKVLLRTLLSRSSEEEEEEEESEPSSGDQPSLLGDGGEARVARPAREERHAATAAAAAAAVQGVQSGEEDSQDESPVESIPIKETKAYQLLKQSATQERLESSGEEEESLSGKSDGREEDRGRAERSSHQDPYPRKGKMNTKIYPALQSKAFWGESDDSNSEIEAALRPQPFNANNDEFEDF